MSDPSENLYTEIAAAVESCGALVTDWVFTYQVTGTTERGNQGSSWSYLANTSGPSAVGLLHLAADEIEGKWWSHDAD